jgi:hypothetical protein
VARKEMQAFPPVFIIGPPRSGTTLLHQVLIARYQFVYFTNFTALLYRVPTIAAWLAQKASPDEGVSDYVSQYGKTASWHGPHECGEFWYRWFPRGDYVYVAPGITATTHSQELRREITGMSKVAKAPALFKNTYNSMRIAPIVEAFPEACFLVCCRDPAMTAQSILVGRQRLYGDKERWLGVPPRNIDQIKQHHYCEQAVEQVYYTYRQIDEDRCRFGEERFHNVVYENLCNDTRETLGNIGEFLRDRGVSPLTRGDAPARFPVSDMRKISNADCARIKEKVTELWK